MGCLLQIWENLRFWRLLEISCSISICQQVSWPRLHPWCTYILPPYRTYTYRAPYRTYPIPNIHIPRWFLIIVGTLPESRPEWAEVVIVWQWRVVWRTIPLHSSGSRTPLSSLPCRLWHRYDLETSEELSTHTHLSEYKCQVNSHARTSWHGKCSYQATLYIVCRLTISWSSIYAWSLTAIWYYTFLEIKTGILMYRYHGVYSDHGHTGWYCQNQTENCWNLASHRNRTDSN